MMKQIIKNYLLAYPRLFKFAKFLRWLPSDAKFFVSVWSHRILHFREIIKADIVLSIGNHCQAAYYMDYYKLRKFSSPIDWMKYYSLDCSERKEIPPRSLVMGVPGKVVRELTDEEVAANIRNAQTYVSVGARYLHE